MERFGCRALVLSSVDYGEADRVVSLFTDTHGRLAAFARGARKSRRRFAGALEPFTLLQAQLVETRGDTFRLDRVEVLDGMGELRQEMGRIARGAYAAELVRELCREREPHPALFELLRGFWASLAREGGGPWTMIRFELGALANAGLMPRLDRCARCGSSSLEEALFDPEHGGLSCARCARGVGSQVSREAAMTLALLQRDSRSGELEAPLPVRAEARAVLSRFMAHHLGHVPKSIEFMRQVGVEA
jgi:DNA repair protein RecO (recombination protein O)